MAQKTSQCQLGDGTTFHFTVRLERQPTDQEDKHIIPDDMRGLKVLIVDDCAESREILQKVLTTFGFRTMSTSLGREAVVLMEMALQQQDPFDLITMDWMMPEMDGIEASKLIHEKFYDSPPILMLTAFGRETERREAEKAGVSAFLTKPVSPSTLFDAIMDVFGKTNSKTQPIPGEITTSTSLHKDRLKGFRVLVAEDNPINQEIAVAVLEKAGIEPIIVTDGKQAVAEVYTNAYDIVLMDIQMPEMDGFEATRSIRGDPRFTKSCPQPQGQRREYRCQCPEFRGQSSGKSHPE